MVNKPTYEYLEQHVKKLEKDTAEYKKAEQKIKHLNTILTSIRNIHHLISEVKTREHFIREVCKTLVKDRGYHNAWIAIINKSGEVLDCADAGLGNNFGLITDKLNQGKFTYCSEKVLKQTRFLAVEEPMSVCEGCPVSHMYDGRGAMAARLSHNGKLYGMLTVSVPAIFSADHKEHALFGDVACDIAFALHNIEVEEERKKTGQELRRALDELEQRVKKRTSELEMLSSKLLNTQEEERKRIAGDLHDGIGQSLSAAKFVVETTLEQLNSKSDLPEISSLKTIVPMLQKASEEVRAIVMNLRPSILDDLGILATIGWFCRQFQSVYSCIRIEEQIRIQEREVSDDLKTIIFRVLQEAMNNIAKHSNAGIARLYLGRTGSAVELIIEDDGQGFDVADLLSAKSFDKGFGITSMKERTELSGGVFTIKSVMGKGTFVQASWPLQ
ncbi:MAG: hypothetical protein GY795_42685 [Desulfobacterales bacterium]|nr:hypothetical protein [Desulfobacterales bacterium]